jgi:enamine deaminase RidA (YjgF/YER057c/UK114 family)
MTTEVSVEDRLAALGLTLPAVIPTRGSFEPFVLIDSMLYLSGKGSPLREGEGPVPKVGAEVSVAEAQAHARDVGLYLLALMREALGGFERVRRVVKVLGMVNAAPDFTRHTEVVNGCSDLFVAALGPARAPCALRDRRRLAAARFRGRDRGRGRHRLNFRFLHRKQAP